MTEMEQSPIPTPHPTLAASPSAASTAGFHKHHSPHKPVPTRHPTPGPRPSIPTLEEKQNFLKLTYFQFPQPQTEGPARRVDWPCCPALAGSPSGCPETHCADAEGGTP